MDNKNYKSLPILTQNQAIAQANEKIKKAMLEKHPGLLTRWPKVNASMGGCWRFGEITALHGASGSGKSYILNMIREDFCNKELNHFAKPYKILSFSFEMSAADELIRTYSSKLATSYSVLTSSETKITEDYYNKIKADLLIEKYKYENESIFDVNLDYRINEISEKEKRLNENYTKFIYSLKTDNGYLEIENVYVDDGHDFDSSHSHEIKYTDDFYTNDNHETLKYIFCEVIDKIFNTNYQCFDYID